MAVASGAANPDHRTRERPAYLVRDHNPAIESTTWYATVTGNPADYQLTVNGTTLNLAPDPDLTTVVSIRDGAIYALAVDLHYGAVPGGTTMEQMRFTVLGPVPRSKSWITTAWDIAEPAFGHAVGDEDVLGEIE